MYSHVRNYKRAISLAYDNQSLNQIVKHEIKLPKHLKTRGFFKRCYDKQISSDPHINNNVESIVNTNSASFTQTEDSKKSKADFRTLKDLFRKKEQKKKSPW